MTSVSRMSFPGNHMKEKEGSLNRAASKFSVYHMQVFNNLQRNCSSLHWEKPLIFSPTADNKSSSSIYTGFHPFPSVTAIIVASCLVSHCCVTTERECRHGGADGDWGELPCLKDIDLSTEISATNTRYHSSSRGHPTTRRPSYLSTEISHTNTNHHSSSRGHRTTRRPHSETFSGLRQQGLRHCWRYNCHTCNFNWFMLIILI